MPLIDAAGLKRDLRASWNKGQEHLAPTASLIWRNSWGLGISLYLDSCETEAVNLVFTCITPLFVRHRQGLRSFVWYRPTTHLGEQAIPQSKISTTIQFLMVLFIPRRFMTTTQQKNTPRSKDKIERVAQHDKPFKERPNCRWHCQSWSSSTHKSLTNVLSFLVRNCCYRSFSVCLSRTGKQTMGIADHHSVSWALAIRYSLPLPAALPILNIALPLTLPFLVPLMTRMGGRARKGVREILHPYAWYFTTLIPLMILVVAAVDGTPSDMVQCNMENRWKQMFRSKNEASVRAIQNALRCCGYNSLHDRAWPFPSHDIDAQACERTQGYARRC